MGCISLYFPIFLVLCKIAASVSAYGMFPFWNFRNKPYYQLSTLPSYISGTNQALTKSYNVNFGGSGGLAPVYDPNLLQRHKPRVFSNLHQKVMGQRQNTDGDCDSDTERPNAAQSLYQKIYGQQYLAVNRNPSLVKELRFIGNEKYFISLMRQKLQKLIKEERKTAIRDQLALNKIKISKDMPLWHGVLHLDEVYSRNEPEEFRYTTLSTFIGDFFCSWCGHSKGRSKRSCLKHCFKGILEKYDNLSSATSENADLDFS